MFDERSLKTDFVAILLLAATAFLALAVFSFDPGDPPSRLVYPVNQHVANICGRLGAATAYGLFQWLGAGAYYFVLSVGCLGGFLLVRPRITEPLLRTSGWLLSLIGFTTLAALALPGLARGTALGGGGYLGAAMQGLLEGHVASAGAYILVVSLIVGGLLLSTDYVLVRIVALLTGRSTQLAGAAVKRVPAMLPARRQPAGLKTDVDKIEIASSDGDEEEHSLTIKRGAKSADEEETPPAEAAAPDASAQPAGETEEAPQTDAPENNENVRVRPHRKSDRDSVHEQLDAASRAEATFDYELPPLDLLLDGEPFSFEEQEKDVRRKAKILEKTFGNFGFKVKVVEVETGPVIAQFEVELEAGLRLSKITSLSEDIAIALRVPSVRIVAPIPGKNTVGIEVPNAERQLVRLREVIEEANGKASKMRIPIYLGKDVSGKPMVADLTSLPHLLIAGRTGTGKSVCLNTIIMSILMARRPDDVRMLLIDPKMVELSSYMKLPHLMHPVVTDMRKAEAILGWAVEKMEERYALLARAGVRHISVYNQLGADELYERLEPENEEERKLVPTHLPYIVIVADEMADLMMTAAKEVEAHIIRLAQKSRAVGIHLILATQKPTVDVITGLIKSNLPARISFQVASRTDSRVVLDEMGADKLLGNGDMLFLWPGTSTLIRGQGAYVSDDEINRVVDFVSTDEPQFVHELVNLKPANAEGEKSGRKDHNDDLYDSAVDLVIREGRGSVSLLQRALGIGYGRAARLIDYMAEDGIVGQYAGSQAREVLITIEQWQEMSGEGADDEPASKPRRPSGGGGGKRAPQTITVSTRRPSDEFEDDASDEEALDDAEAEDEEPAAPAPPPKKKPAPKRLEKPAKARDWADIEDDMDELDDVVEQEMASRGSAPVSNDADDWETAPWEDQDDGEEPDQKRRRA
ncbi:MAG: DNA translocase FtsK [Pirellulales bacterium]|nr:DNA translocase FtsK [Pirellulales bacterium]